MRIFYFVLLFVLLAYPTFSQRKTGTWQDYLSFNNATKVAIAGEKIYCLADGGLFYLNTSDNSINKFTALSGLSDFGIKTIAYSAENKVLVIAYKNSNLDLVFNTGVFNLSDVMRKQMIGDKNIYNISFSGKTAYLSCGFGIVAINLEKKEVQDTYMIGSGGTALKINDIEVSGQVIYAATDQGIFSAGINNPNLLDYRSWNKIETIPHSSGKFSHLVNHAGNLTAVYTPEQWDRDELYRLKNGAWERFMPQLFFYAFDMQSNDGFITISSRDYVFVIDSNGSIQGSVHQYILFDKTVDIEPRSAVFSSTSGLWIADYKWTLVRGITSGFLSYVPDGPSDNKVFSLKTVGNRLWVATGGYDDGWGNTYTKAGVKSYSDGKWINYPLINPEMSGYFDLVCIAPSPSDPGHFFAGTWGAGVLEFKDTRIIQRYSQPNSTLESATPNQPNDLNVRVGGLCFDDEGNLWVTNSEVPEVLSVRKPTGEWQSFSLPEVANKLKIGQIIVTQSGSKWIVVPRGHNVYVINNDATKKRHLPVMAIFINNETELITDMNDVYAIAEDHNGEIWLGTSIGVAVYKNPERVWVEDPFYARQPSLDLKDGQFHPLLKTEIVTAIAVDGANRKWLGTKNSGVYLVSEEGQNEIIHFTTENSPLFSNSITGIAIADNGEVFFGTSEGLISYQGEASRGSENFKEVYVYPNPVRETYSGPVVIKGLLEKTDVRITDIAGNLVFSGESLGGQLLWDGKNLNRNRVKTGVYLVFCSDPEGNETHVTKLLFIH